MPCTSVDRVVRRQTRQIAHRKPEENKTPREKEKKKKERERKKLIVTYQLKVTFKPNEIYSRGSVCLDWR